MTHEKLNALRMHSTAPFNHEEYSVWLHNRILEEVQREIHGLLQNTEQDVKTRMIYHKIMHLESLKLIR